MDPVSAFSVVCGVIQIVDVGYKVSKELYEAYQSATGLSKSRQRLLDESERIKRLLQSANQCSRSGSNTSDPLEQDINAIIAEAATVAQELLDELEKIKIDPNAKTVKRIAQAGNNFRNRKTITNLQGRFRSLQQQLQSSLVVELRPLAKKLLNGQVEGFARFDAVQQKLVSDIDANTTSVRQLSADLSGVNQAIQLEGSSLRSHVTSDGRKTRTEVISEVRQVRDQINTLDDKMSSMNLESHHQRLLDELFFPQMYDRETQIHEAAPATFQWILEDSHFYYGENNFLRWLQGPETCYWISGKAGSGKSTLMRYMILERRNDVERALKSWCGSSQVVLAEAFFWNSGTTLQKSTEGLLRCLLHQILKSHPHLMPLVSADEAQRLGQGRSWSTLSLKKMLRSLLDCGSTYFCLFIDGLDEFEEGSVASGRKLLTLFEEVGATGFAKFCFSSRPDPVFSTSFEFSKQLKLHDLTVNDMTVYVTQRIGDFADADMIDEIVEKAEGVFLWTNFATKSLEAAHLNGDTHDQINKRLKALPPELNDMYDHMLNKIDSSYYEEVAVYFAMVLNHGLNDTNTLIRKNAIGYNHSTSVLEIFFALNPSFWNQVLDLWPVETLKRIRDSCRQLRLWVRSRSCGMLEIKDPSIDNIINLRDLNGQPTKPALDNLEKPEMKMLFDEIDDASRTIVKFTHQSVAEYFQNTPESVIARKMFLFSGVKSWLRYEMLYLAFKRSGWSLISPNLDIRPNLTSYHISAICVLWNYYELVYQRPVTLEARRLKELLCKLFNLGGTPSTVHGWQRNPQYFLHLLAYHDLSRTLSQILDEDDVRSWPSWQQLCNQLLKVSLSPFQSWGLDTIPMLIQEGADPHDETELVLLGRYDAKISAWRLALESFDPFEDSQAQEELAILDRLSTVGTLPKISTMLSKELSIPIFFKPFGRPTYTVNCLFERNESFVVSLYDLGRDGLPDLDLPVIRMKLNADKSFNHEKGGFALFSLSARIALLALYLKASMKWVADVKNVHYVPLKRFIDREGALNFKASIEMDGKDLPVEPERIRDAMLALERDDDVIHWYGHSVKLTI